MRVWIDITAPAHVLVFRPLVEIMRGRGDEVEITARDYAQTLELLELHGAGRVTLKTETHPLDAVNDVLDALRGGDVTGRAVLVP